MPPRDDRRRRVLTDEVIGQATAASAAPAAEAPRALRRKIAYGDAKFMDGQPRITDLVPLRWPFIALWFLLGVTIVAGLVALYAWMPELAQHTTDGRVAAFDLDSEGSLGAVYSSVTLALAGCLALVIYSVRRHKQDDYQGRYRIWLWAACCWFVMAIDESASLHEGFKEMMTLLTGTRLMGDGSLWWVAAYLVVLGIVGLRLLLEIRVCRLSTTAMFLTAACYATAVVVQLELVLPQSGARGVMVEETCEMVGNLFLVLGMSLHARYVILQSQGLLTARRAKPAKKSAPEESDDRRVRRARTKEESAATSSAARQEQSSGAARTPLGHLVRSGMRADQGGAQPQPHSKLTKAERKALRRQQRADQEDRELRTR